MLQEDIAQSHSVLAQHAIQLPRHLCRQRIRCLPSLAWTISCTSGASRKASHLIRDQMASSRLGFQTDLALFPFRHGGLLQQVHSIQNDNNYSSSRTGVQLQARQLSISVTCRMCTLEESASRRASSFLRGFSMPNSPREKRQLPGSYPHSAQHDEQGMSMSSGGEQRRPFHVELTYLSR